MPVFPRSRYVEEQAFETDVYFFAPLLVNHTHIAALANSKKTREGAKSTDKSERTGKLCIWSVTLHNFQTKRRGRKIGSL